MEVSIHAFNRINERVSPVSSMHEAKRMAEEAYKKGYTLEQLQKEYKHLARYMEFKLKGESERTEARIYKECFWLWNGRRKVLRTVYPIERSIPIKRDFKKMKKQENICYD